MWLSSLLIGLIRFLIQATPEFRAPLADSGKHIFYANHSSHLDSLAIWAALPREIRRRTRPVAARDYWERNAFRRYLARRGFNALLIDRRPADDLRGSPLATLCEALERGESLILFPEGTRHVQALPGEFKSGLYHLANRYPDANLVPVYLDNLHRSMPKGSHLPVPLACSVRLGAPLARIDGEAKADFLRRARDAIVELAA